MLHNGRNMLKLGTMKQVGDVRTMMDCLIMKIDPDGLLLDTSESEEDEAGRVIYR